MNTALSYDNVYLKPKYSTLQSRSLAGTSVYFCGHIFKLPIVPANMVDVISPLNAKWLAENGYFYIMHRFEGITPQFIHNANELNLPLISVSVGTKDYQKELDLALKLKHRIDFITIDVAHAHHEALKPCVEYIKSNFPKTKIIAGNVATSIAVKFLASLKVDAIKVGIGGGSICSTKYQTGFHLPTLESLKQIYDGEFSWIPLIADGGIKHYGDIAKALVFNAKMVMSGSLFASCIDSPACIRDGKKVYRGSTSYELKGENKHIEGRTLEIEQAITYSERMEEIKQALQSSISYAGGKDISALKNNVEWIQV